MSDQFRVEDTRESYDRVAARYAEEIAGELEDKPFDRQFLDRLAESLAGRGRVVELGCGPAHVAAYLADRGVDVSGLDLSPGMVAQARRLPTLEVVVGDMLDLPFQDETLAGVVAFYSIIHFDDGQLSAVFREMARVLKVGGLCALAFHIGDEIVHRDEWWDQPVAVDFRFLQPAHVTNLLTAAGFELTSVEERAPYPEVEYQSHRAYLVARRDERPVR